MNFLRSLVLGTRYALDRARRRRCVDAMSRENRAPISVLFYHRVADRDPNDWTIPTSKFVRHLEYCQRHFDLISLAEAQRRIRQRMSPRPAVAITFDDGYADNMEFAIPWMLRNQIPCAYFVTTNHIRTGHPFAHDVQFGRPLPVNTVDEIREMAESGIEIGVHSASHLDFNTITTRRELQAETVDAKMDLEMMINKSVSYFAVPFGLPPQLRPAVIQIVRECGMKGICSAYGGYNLVGDDPFHIRRIHGDLAFIRLRNWLSFDQRKRRQEPQLLREDLHFDDEPSRCEPIESKRWSHGTETETSPQSDSGQLI